MYVANEVSPAFPVHPGSILGEELKARGISQKRFAQTVGLQATHLNALIHGTRNFTAPVAAKIASGLSGIPAELWMKLQDRYNIDCQRKRFNTSKYVSGYGSVNNEYRQAILAETPTVYGSQIQIALTIPETDIELLKSMAMRLGWTLK